MVDGRLLVCWLLKQAVDSFGRWSKLVGGRLAHAIKNGV
jgi:hypothetical protein